MGLDPRTFYTEILKRGLSRDFLFRVTGIVLDRVAIIAEESNDLIFARAASYPGRIIEDMPVNYYGHEYHLAGRAKYTNAASYAIEFYVPGDFSLRDKLEKASRIAHEDGIGKEGISTSNWITLKGLKGPAVSSSESEVKLIGAQIRDIGEIKYSIADGTGEVAVFAVTFAYQKYEIT